MARLRIVSELPEAATAAGSACKNCTVLASASFSSGYASSMRRASVRSSHGVRNGCTR
jgi:hypothetical protein